MIGINCIDVVNLALGMISTFPFYQEFFTKNNVLTFILEPILQIIQDNINQLEDLHFIELLLVSLRALTNN
jgi:hypothetical protein